VPFNVAIGLAISRDEGATFEKYGRGPILSYSLHEPFVLSGPKIRKFEDRFYLFYISGSKWVLENGRPEPVYKIRVAVSENGVDWKKVGRDLITDVLDDEEAQASPDVFFSSGKYHMFFCYRQGRDYRNASRGYRIGYAYSTDLMNWTRDDAKAGLLPSDKGWDAEMVSYPHLTEINGKIYMFYLGDSVGRWGFGVAELKGKLE
jgi:sucrose-6-phosphate hydrolase SacC (GH32 family)